MLSGAPLKPLYCNAVLKLLWCQYDNDIDNKQSNSICWHVVEAANLCNHGHVTLSSKTQWGNSIIWMGVLWRRRGAPCAQFTVHHMVVPSPCRHYFGTLPNHTRFTRGKRRIRSNAMCSVWMVGRRPHHHHGPYLLRKQTTTMTLPATSTPISVGPNCTMRMWTTCWFSERRRYVPHIDCRRTIGYGNNGDTQYPISCVWLMICTIPANDEVHDVWAGPGYQQANHP